MTTTMFLHRDASDKSEGVKPTIDLRPQTDDGTILLEFAERGHGYSRDDQWFWVSNEVHVWLDTAQLQLLQEKVNKALEAIREKELNIEIKELEANEEQADSRSERSGN